MSIEQHRPEPNFPMPNDKLAGGIVVASTYYNDDIVLVLLLNPEVPFFTVGDYYLVDVVDQAEAGHFMVFDSFKNIVPAVREYEQNGGDY